MGIQAYQVAFAEASSELRDIVEQFDKLRARKELVEKVVEALKPVAGFAGQVAVLAPQPAGSLPSHSPQGFESSLGSVPGIRPFLSSNANAN
jgi:hypothetical protein